MKRKAFGATSFFAVIVALLVMFTAYDYYSKEKQDQKKDEDTKVVQLKKDGVSELQITSPKETRLFVKKDGLWQIVKPLQETADQSSVLNTLDSIFAERIADTVKEDKGQGDLQFGPYGLDHPLFDLKITAATASQDVKIGSIKAFDGSLYGQINDQKKVVLLSSAWDVILSKPINEFRDKRLYRGDLKAEFDSVVVDGRTSEGPVHFEIDRTDDTWNLKSQKPTDAIDKDNVERWLEQIKALRGAEFVPLASNATNFQADRTITLSRKGAEPFVLKIARDKRNFDNFHATSSDLPAKSREQLTLAKGATDAIVLGPEAFFSRKAPFAFDAQDVARVIFSDAKTGKKIDSPTDKSQPDIMISKLKALEAVRFLGSPNEKKFPSSLRLLKSDGTLIFEMSWGEAVIEKATAEKPEARYLPVRTNLSKQVIGVAEKSIADLSESRSATIKEK